MDINNIVILKNVERLFLKIVNTLWISYLDVRDVRCCRLLFHFENVVNQMDIDAKIFSKSAIVLGRAYGFMVISVTPLFWVLDTA